MNRFADVTLRSQILTAVRTLEVAGERMTYDGLRAEGVRGARIRIMSMVHSMIAEGLIAAEAWHSANYREHQVVPALEAIRAARPVEPDLEPAPPRKRDRAVKRELSARRRSRVWVREHRARWRRILVIEGRPHPEAPQARENWQWRD